MHWSTNVSSLGTEAYLPLRQQSLSIVPLTCTSPSIAFHLLLHSNLLTFCFLRKDLATIPVSLSLHFDETEVETTGRLGHDIPISGDECDGLWTSSWFSLLYYYIKFTHNRIVAESTLILLILSFFSLEDFPCPDVSISKRKDRKGITLKLVNLASCELLSKRILRIKKFPL